MSRLTDTKIRALRPGTKDQWLSDGNGLYLRIRPGGSRVWVVRRRELDRRASEKAGRPRHRATVVTLGDYGTISLKEARAKAAQLALEGRARNPTVQDAAEEWYRERVEAKHKRAHFVRGYLDRAILPELGRRRIREVTRGDVVDLVRDYRERGTRAAGQLLSTVRQFLAYALEVGYLEANPADGVTQQVSGYEARPRARVLTDAELRLLWAEPHENAALPRFLVLTGLRIGEARRGHREGDRWIVPAAISKNGRAHWVHLPDQAKAQIGNFARTTPTNIQGWMRRWCERHGIDPRFTPHDCRRTASTRMHDLGVAPHIVERVLNHTLQGVMAAYNHAEYQAERVEAAERLAAHIAEVVR